VRRVGVAGGLAPAGADLAPAGQIMQPRMSADENGCGLSDELQSSATTVISGLAVYLTNFEQLSGEILKWPYRSHAPVARRSRSRPRRRWQASS
jgi:hypothetical protein